MGEICTSPFDGDSFYDLNMKKAMDVQIFNASLALYKAEDIWIIVKAQILSITIVDFLFKNI